MVIGHSEIVAFLLSRFDADKPAPLLRRGLAHPRFLMFTVSQLRLPHLSRFSKGGRHGRVSNAFCGPALHRWQRRMELRRRPPGIPSSRYPPFENREGWGSLSYYGADKNKGRPSPAQNSKFSIRPRRAHAVRGAT